MKTLHLVLSFKWFDLIKSGKKTTEYREMSEHWNKKFKGNGHLDYKKVRLQRGYTKNPETMLFEIDSICPTGDKNDLNLSEAWAIRLGKRIEENV